MSWLKRFLSAVRRIVRSLFRMNAPSKTESLRLVVDVLAELEKTHSSLDGKPIEGPTGKTRIFTVRYMMGALDGFVALRKGGKDDAARILVRPMIEKTFFLKAVEKTPSSLFALLRTDFEQEVSWLKAMKVSDDHESIVNLRKNWDFFAGNFAKKYPNYRQELDAFASAYEKEFGENYNEAKLQIRQIARFADLEGYYNTYYRLYCQFSHGALRAIATDSRPFDLEDDITAAFSGIIAMDTLRQLGADAPRIDELWARQQAMGARLDDSVGLHP